MEESDPQYVIERGALGSPILTQKAFVLAKYIFLLSPLLVFIVTMAAALPSGAQTYYFSFRNNSLQQIISSNVIISTFVSFFTIPFGWIMPDFKDLALLCMIGFLGGAANLWLSQSFKLSEVSLVSPLKYLALVFGIIFGYLIWDEVPTIKTLLGASLVVVSSIIIFRREIYYKKQDSLPRHE